MVDEDDRHPYVTVMLPSVFAPWAELLVDALAPRPGSRAADVATGPGTVARVIARRIGALGRVYGCDLSTQMLAMATGFAPESRSAAIEYLACAADRLPLPDGVVDAIACQFALSFFPDPVHALAEMHRIARPGARLAASVWRGLDEMPVFEALVQAAEQVLGDSAGLRIGPFALSDPARLREAAEQAGWQQVRVSPRDLPIEVASVADVVRCYAATPLADRVRALDAAGHRALTDAVRRELGARVDRDGAVRMPTGAHFLTAAA